jgi:hypothetical protein
MAGIISTEPSDYDLKVDSQAEKFVENKQKLTYFLITASVAVIGFVVNFAVTNKVNLPSLVIFTSLAGLLTTGFSLLNLHSEHRSYRLHIQYRYQRKSWIHLTPDEQAHWEKLNDQASLFLECAFAFLFIEVPLGVAFFVIFFS